MPLPRRRRLLQICSALTLLIATVAADCYNPNHTNRNLAADAASPSGTDTYLPCNTVEPYSMCCRNSDSCLPNGLCQQAGSSKIWRESCSDQTWKSDSCLKLCSSGDDATGDQIVEQCDDESWCCGSGSNNATTCCEQGKGSWIVDGKVSKNNPNGTSTPRSSSSASSSSSSTTSSKSSTKTSTPTHHSTSSQEQGTSSTSSTNAPIPRPAATVSASSPTPSKSSTGNKSSNTGAIVGGIVGGVVAVALLGFLAFFLLRRRKQKKNAVPPKPQITPMNSTFLHEAPGGNVGGSAGRDYRGQGVPYQYPVEKQQPGAWSEVPGSAVGGELDGGELDGRAMAELGRGGRSPRYSVSK